MDKAIARQHRNHAHRGARRQFERVSSAGPVAAPAGRLQRTAGNRATLRLLRSSSSRGFVSRQPTSTTAGAPKSTDYKDYVLGTIKAFKQGAATYADPSVLMTGAIFNRVIDAWYRMVIGQEEIIDKNLASDAKLKADLH